MENIFLDQILWLPMLQQQIKIVMLLMVPLVIQLMIMLKTSVTILKECTDTQLPWILKQLQNIAAEQHSKYINHQNEEMKSQETKNMSTSDSRC